MTSVSPSDWQKKRAVERRDGPHLCLRDGFLWLEPPALPTKAELAEWKKLGGRKQKGKTVLRFPRLVSVARKLLEDKRIVADPSVPAWLHTVGELGQWPYEIGALKLATSRIEELYPYQRLAASHLAFSDYRGLLLALSPGLGKTPVSIVAAESMGLERVLVIAPKPLLKTWKRECEKWSESCGTPAEATICHRKSPASSGWVITNYDTVVRNASAEFDEYGKLLHAEGEYLNEHWDLVILDESVAIKNRKTKRFKVVRALMKTSTDRVWLLSGAPVVSGNDDLWTQLHVIEPEYFTSFWRFAEAYSYVEDGYFGTTIVGSKDLDLRAEFPELVFARSQDEVLSELPEYIFKDIEVEMTKKQAKVYRELEGQWIARLEENPDTKVQVTNQLSEMARCLQASSNLVNLNTALDPGEDPWPDESGKADALLELLKAEGEIELALLVWVWWKPGAEALYGRLLRDRPDLSVGLVHGDTKHQDDIIEDYKNGMLDVLIMSLGVGKYGHSLQNTKTMVYFDKTWQADAFYQSLHRVRRFGLKHSPVVISLRARGTADELVELNLAGKMKPLASVTGTELAKILRSLGR